MELVKSNSKTIIGIDNGVTGTIGIVNGRYGSFFSQVPAKKEQDFTKKKKIVGRIDTVELRLLLEGHVISFNNSLCLLERPMINPTRFNASMVAGRAHEATLVILEQLGIPHMFTDSRNWGKMLLPSGCTGTTELKRASKDIGTRLFPQFKEEIKNHGDADGLLIAEYGWRTYGK